MSFLYKALIKEQSSQSVADEANASGSHNSTKNMNNKTGSSGASSQSANQSQLQMSGNSNNGYSYANSVNSGQAFANDVAGTPAFSWLAWLAIAILLLIVGLLGGYIVGSQPPTITQVATQAISPVKAQPNGQAESDATAQAPSNKPSELLEQAPDEQLSETSQVVAEKQLETDEKPLETGEKLLDTGKKPLETGKQEAVDEPEQLVINVADINSSNVKVEDVSSDLQARFAEALAQTEDSKSKQTNNQQRSIQVEVDSSLVDISDLPDGDRAFIPELKYEMHIYSSDANERWVRINNTTLYEGDRLTPYLRLAEIRQGIVIWESRDRRFSQTALEDYK